MTETTSITLLSAVVDGYFAMWNETEPARRRAVMEATWTPEGRYLSPLFAADGPAALDALVTALHERYPRHSFRLTGVVDAHHDRARWGWELTGPTGGPAVAAGIDIAVLAPDGRLREVTGFFEPPQ